MYHSVLFDGLDCFDEWNIVPSSRPVIASPSQKTSSLEIPGANGSLDTSDILAGHPTFNNRTGSIDFYVLNDEDDYDWVKKKNTFMRFLHGQKHRLVLEDEPDWFYYGRFTGEWQTNSDWSHFVVSYNLDPYKYSTILYRMQIPTNFTFQMTADQIGDMPFDPTFSRVSNPNVTLTINVTKDSGDQTLYLYPGDTKLYELNIYQEDVTFEFSGNSIVQMEFRKGML